MQGASTTYNINRGKGFGEEGKAAGPSANQDRAKCLHLSRSEGADPRLPAPGFGGAPHPEALARGETESGARSR